MSAQDEWEEDDHWLHHISHSLSVTTGSREEAQFHVPGSNWCDCAACWMEGHDTRLQTGVLRQMEGRVGSLRSLGSKGSEKLHETWRRLSFLRILIFDVGLSLAKTLNDFLQAYAIIGITDIGNLSFESHHILGLSYVLVLWVPLPLVLVHLHLCHQLPRLDQGPRAALALILVVFLWPLIPTFVYTSLLFTTRTRARKKEWRVRRRFL